MAVDTVTVPTPIAPVPVPRLFCRNFEILVLTPARNARGNLLITQR